MATESPVRSSCVAGVIGWGPDERLPAREWAARHFPALAFTPEQVVAASVPWLALGPKPSSGLYFLQRAGRICYVGMASDLADRLIHHRSDGRPFDAVTVIARVPKDCLRQLEAAYRTAWQPPWNWGPTHATTPAALALLEALSAMSLGLICDQPELAPFTPEEIEAICAKLDGPDVR
jgi:hypothetical protein